MIKNLQNLTYLCLVSILLLNATANNSWSQVNLSGTSYTQDFDAIGSGLPAGWTVRTGASATSLGVNATLTTAPTNWGNTSGAFKNFASADGLISSSTPTDQSGSTDRVLGVRQTGAFGDPGAAFVLQLANTTNLTGFKLSFKLQSLDVASPRTSAWQVDYGIGSTPGSFTTIASANSLTTGSAAFANKQIDIDFGSALNNQSETVWIRIVTLTASTGTGNRPSTGIDDVILSYGNISALPSLTINDISIAEGNAGTTNTSFTVSLSQPAPEGGVSFGIATADNTATAESDYITNSANGFIVAGETSYTFDVSVIGDELFEPNETFFVNITNVSGTITLLDGQGTGTITNDDAAPLTPIYAIQGSGTASLIVGQTVSTTGIVTGDYQGSTGLNGFYIQDAAGDNNPATSDGIFVFAPNSIDIAVGQVVQLSGRVSEFSSQTQLDNISGLTVVGSGSIAPITVTLPVNPVTDLERYEGMMVQFTQTLTVTENFNLARFGEVLLSANPGYAFGGDGRLYNPTNFIDPTDIPTTGVENDQNNIAAVTTQQTTNTLSSILLDDASNTQNPAVVPYVSAEKTLRTGSTVTNLTGVLGFGFNVYRIQPTVAPGFVYGVRPLTPPATGNANLKIASFNVLNYFNGDGQGGGFPTSRGATTLTEFNRQQTKIVAALSALNADIVGLIEIENDGDGANSAIRQLVSELNKSVGAGTYDYIRDPASPGTGTDEIKVAFIYKPGVVTPVGSALADLDPVHNRPPLAQLFQLNSSGEKVTAIINHFKSKSGAGTGDNADQGDGQGAFNADRIAQAEALVQFMNETVIPAASDPDVILLGDLNAYAEEDPIDVLREAGFINLFGPESYSYVFSGQSGSLDHALVSPSLFGQFTAGGKWHINADEPRALDYNQEFNPAYLYQENPFRSSDHDPVVVGLRLYTPAVSFAEATKTVNEGDGTYLVNLSLTEKTYQPATVTISLATNGVTADDFSTAPAVSNNTITIDIPAGSSTASFSLNITDDQVDEPAESLTFTIASVSSGLKPGSQLSSIITIVDNDVPEINFSQAEASIEEKSGTYTVILPLSIPPVTNQTVTIHIDDNDFVYGKNDYVTNPDGKQGSFTLPVPAGSSSVTFTVTPDKNAVKKKESQSIEFSISKVSDGLSIGMPDVFTLNITDEKSGSGKTYFYVWPNPTQSIIRIFSNVNEPVDAVLRSSWGEILFTGNGTTEELSKQLSNLLPEKRRGLYILQISYKGKSTILKIIKW